MAWLFNTPLAIWYIFLKVAFCLAVRIFYEIKMIKTREINHFKILREMEDMLRIIPGLNVRSSFDLNNKLQALTTKTTGKCNKLKIWVKCSLYIIL